MSDFLIRAATANDTDVIVRYNCDLAWESENKKLDQETVVRGVRNAIASPEKARYFVAEKAGRVIGQIMHTLEFSDWRNGDIWWIQSVYVHPDHRRTGVFRDLFDHLATLAKTSPNVVGLRLYVENSNSVAQQVYRSLGMETPGYHVMEKMPL